MTNHPNRKPYVEIKNGCIRLYHDGRVMHWDGGVSRYRAGWGPYATTATIGEDERVLKEWRRERQVD
jgi:hypothetical protein